MTYSTPELRRLTQDQVMRKALDVFKDLYTPEYLDALVALWREALNFGAIASGPDVTSDMAGPLCQSARALWSQEKKLREASR